MEAAKICAWSPPDLDFKNFVASFVSMNGFDALKDIYDRFVINVKNSKGGEE